jgi:hypothetical protein
MVLFIKPGYHGHTCAILFESSQRITAAIEPKHITGFNCEFKFPGCTHQSRRHYVVRLCGQAHYLQQSFPVALLISGLGPVAQALNVLPGTIAKRYLSWTKTASYSSVRAIKQCFTYDLHC